MIFSMFTISDWISLASGVCSLMGAIIIGGLQIWQNWKQIKIEGRRRQEASEIEARKFISANYEFRGLIPLCAIAVAYDPHRFYHRKMYNDFRLLSRDTQNRIFEHCGWRMCDYKDEDFMGYCMAMLNQAFGAFAPCTCFGRMFNDNGKYVERSILRYAKDELPHRYFTLNIDLRKMICKEMENCGKNMNIIEEVCSEYNFRVCDEIEACQIACAFAGAFTEYVAPMKYKNNDIDYGYPGGWAGEGIETMEDLFLKTLFLIWASLRNKAPSV